MELVGLEIRQHGIHEQDPILGAMFVKNFERCSATGRLDRIPSRSPEFVVKVLTELGVGTDDEDIDRSSIFKAGKLRDRSSHGIVVRLTTLKIRSQWNSTHDKRWSLTALHYCLVVQWVLVCRGIYILDWQRQGYSKWI